ncbi:MAG: hypothetical protein J5872_03855 [Lachnospiraceae bacterium]|nr:hypothetical protein [Lachnospiraceae bacterium]
MRSKGSLTVEAAFVVPLSFFAVILFFNLFLFLQIQMRVQKEIASIGNELMPIGTILGTIQPEDGETASVLESAGVSGMFRRLGTESYLSCRMAEKVGGESWLKHIRNGEKGFSFEGSEIYDGDMDIRILVSYSFVLSDAFFGVGSIPVKQQVVARGFSGAGRQFAEAEGEEEEEEKAHVYVTENGTVFHRLRECTYLKPDIRQVSPERLPDERNSSGAKYYACEYCGNKGNGSVYYITPYGTRYHTTVSCQELLRKVSELTEEEAVSRGYRPCSKCGGKTE